MPYWLDLIFMMLMFLESIIHADQIYFSNAFTLCFALLYAFPNIMKCTHEPELVQCDHDVMVDCVWWGAISVMLWAWLLICLDRREFPAWNPVSTCCPQNPICNCLLLTVTVPIWYSLSPYYFFYLSHSRAL